MTMSNAARLSRRAALQSVGLIGATVGLGTVSRPASAYPRLPNARYDFTRPQDNLDALMRIQGDASGAATFMYAQGRAYAALPDGLPRYMSDMQAVRASRFLRNPDGSYEQHYFAAVYIVDGDTGRYLERFENPINGHVADTHVRGARLLILQHAYNGSRWIDPETSEVNPVNPWSYNYLDPFLLTWSGAGDVGWCIHQTPFVAQKFSWNDHNKWRFLISDLEGDAPSIPAAFSFNGEGPYWSWTGLSEGYQTYQMLGGKCGRAEEIPAAILKNLEQLHPEVLEGPPRRG
jgi:hypothetical protein